MPARSNDFQRLVKYLEEQLAPTGANVEESAMVADLHNGTLREVDILITVPVSGREFTIGIETRDHKRRGDLPWIEQVRSKYDLLPIDRRVVVSRRGFSDAALTRAKLYRIETLSLTAATNLRWASLIHRMTSVNVEQEDVSVGDIARVQFVKLHPDQPPPTKITDKLRFADGRVWSITQFNDYVLQLPKIAEGFGKLIGDNKGGEFEVRFTLAPDTMIDDEAGTTFRALSVLLSITINRSRGSIVLNHAAYRDSAVATGTGTIGGLPLSITLAEPHGGTIKGRAIVQYPQGEQTLELGRGRRRYVKKPPAK
jgi:hypothetical protein